MTNISEKLLSEQFRDELARVIYKQAPAIQPWDGDPFLFDEAGAANSYERQLAVKQADVVQALLTEAFTEKTQEAPKPNPGMFRKRSEVSQEPTLQTATGAPKPSASLFRAGKTTSADVVDVNDLFRSVPVNDRGEAKSRDVIGYLIEKHAVTFEAARDKVLALVSQKRLVMTSSYGLRLP